MKKPPKLQPPSVYSLLLSYVLKVCALHQFYNGILEPKYSPCKSDDRKYKFTGARFLSDMNKTEAYCVEDKPEHFAIL